MSLLRKFGVEMVKQIVEERRPMMKTLNDYMSMNYRMEIVEDKNEGGFVISYPELPGLYYLRRNRGNSS